MDNSVENVASSQVSEQAQGNSSAQVAPATQAERMFAQAQVDSIVGTAKREAVEAYKRQQTQYQQPPQYQSNDMQGSYRQESRGISEDEARRIGEETFNNNLTKLQQEAANHANTQAADRIVSSFKNKIATGQDKYEDFGNVTSKLNMGVYPNVVRMLAEHVDNASDVLYHLAQNRTKLNELESTYERYSEDGIYEMKRLSDSIKSNEQNANVRHANQPLSQIRSSSAGSDSRVLSMKDLKAKYKA